MATFFFFSIKPADEVNCIELYIKYQQTVFFLSFITATDNTQNTFDITKKIQDTATDII